MPIFLALLALAAVGAIAASMGKSSPPSTGTGTSPQTDPLLQPRQAGFDPLTNLPADLQAHVAAAESAPATLGYEGLMNLQQAVRAVGFPGVANDLVSLAQSLPGAPPSANTSMVVAALQTNNPVEMNRVADILQQAGYIAASQQLRTAAMYAPQGSPPISGGFAK